MISTSSANLKSSRRAADWEVTVTNTTRQRIPLARFREIIRVALADLGITHAAVNVAFVGERRMATLARRKGRSGATNVLAFGYRETRNDILGDVFICVPFAVREAPQFSKTPEEHLVGLLVHGIVHLAGHAHETDKQANQMEAREGRILARVHKAEGLARNKR